LREEYIINPSPAIKPGSLAEGRICQLVSSSEMMNHNAHILPIDSHSSAVAELQKISVSPEGVPLMTTKCLSYCIKLERVDVRAANILKQQMLSLGGDAAVSKHTLALKGGETDIILIGTHKQLSSLDEKLSNQPFQLSNLSQEVRRVIANYQRRNFTIDFPSGPISLNGRILIMGTLNLTPDSFAGDGIYNDPGRAVDYALQMVEEGADIIDVGGASTRPGFAPLSVKEELGRVIPVLKRLRRETTTPISIDTYKPEVARESLELGVDMVNDISGLRHSPQMVQLLTQYRVPVVLMHIPTEVSLMHQYPGYGNLLSEVVSGLRSSLQRAVDAGLSPEKAIIDPGIGFGKKPQDNLVILKNLSVLKSLGRPILVGCSRKSFIGKALNLPVEERLEGTMAAVAMAVLNGAHIVRVHDPGPIKLLVQMLTALQQAGSLEKGKPTPQV